MAAAGYHGDREARAQGSPQPAKETVLGAGGKPCDSDEVAGAQGVPEPFSCPQSPPPKFYPSHHSCKPTSNPPEPLFLQLRPLFSTHSRGPAVLAGNRKKKNLGGQEGEEGQEECRQDRAIFMCQALG